MPTFSSLAHPRTTTHVHPRTGRHLTTMLLAVLAAVAVMLVGVPAAEAMPDTGGPACVRHDTTATLTPGPASPRYRIAGWLCTPPHPNGTVQVLLSGYTYDHTYWTTPDPAADWVSAALGSGQSVYMIDRVGVGASDKPPADQITADTEATVTHQIVTALRDGALGHYRKVVGVGHSYGSIVWMAEAASHHDVDALVLTGILHGLSPDQITNFANDLYPAVADPKFAYTVLPAGYLTTQPGTRAKFFLDANTALPGAAAWDEASKSTGTSGELTFTPETETSFSKHIRVPVLTIVGADDALLCTADLPCGTGAQLCQRERPDYAVTTPLAMASIPETGHSITLHRTAPAAEAIANRWITHPASRIPGVTTCRS
jgi:pimeloyl-ACP methyl ester carboxylesterase